MSIPTMSDRYKACMLLGAVGDCLAYRNGDWEFQRDGARIHEELNSLGGYAKLSPQGLIVSDDTVMHLATARGLVTAGPTDKLEEVFTAIAKEYVGCMDDMSGRAPGITCIRGARQLLKIKGQEWVIPFDKAGGGCGGAMRSMCIGLRYWKEEDEHKLIAVAIESGRMTHNHPTGYLGSLVSALFTAYAIRGIDPVKWGHLLVSSVLDKALRYVEEAGRDVDDAKKDNNWNYFQAQWKSYLEDRKIDQGTEMKAEFPEKYDVKERDEYYKKLSWDGWGGSSGHDAPMIAYDALLGCDKIWTDLMDRAFFHGGDSDSTGIIAGCWFGAIYGFNTVFEPHYEGIEKQKEIEDLAARLFELAGHSTSSK